MTELFAAARKFGHIATALLAIVVLGISAYHASQLPSNFNHDFTIFAVVVSALTVFTFLFSMSRVPTPLIESISLFVLAVLWLSMGAWDADIMGSTQCDSLGSQRIQTKTGTMSSRSYCYEMRVVEAFSWMLSALFAIFLWIVISLALRAQATGNPEVWSEPIFELPWFGQNPDVEEGGYLYGPGRYPGAPLPPIGYPMSPTMGRQGGPGAMGMSMGGGPYMGQYPAQGGMGMNGQNVVQQKPGHSVVIQPGGPGGRAVVEQVPVM